MARSDDFLREGICKDVLFEYVERQIWRQNLLGHVVIFNMQRGKLTVTLETL